MNYDYQERNLAFGAKVSRRELEMIGVHADTADHIANMVQGFIDRHRGGGDVAQIGRESVSPPLGYSANLERLGKNLQRLDELARDLGNIG